MFLISSLKEINVFIVKIPLRILVLLYYFSFFCIALLPRHHPTPNKHGGGKFYSFWLFKKNFWKTNRKWYFNCHHIAKYSISFLNMMKIYQSDFHFILFFTVIEITILVSSDTIHPHQKTTKIKKERIYKSKLIMMLKKP